MAAFSGQLVLALNGIPVLWIKSMDYKCNTNRELVVGMSPTSTPVGHVNGTKEYTLSLDCYVPKIEIVRWEDIEDAVIMTVPRDGGSPSMLFTGCFTTSVGLTFQEKGAAIRKIEMGAKFKVEI